MFKNSREKRLSKYPTIGVYHKAKSDIAAAILSTQSFLSGTIGTQGGGIYFATDPRSTHHKAIQLIKSKYPPNAFDGTLLYCHIKLGNVSITSKQQNNMTDAKMQNNGHDSILYKRPLSTGKYPGECGDEYVIYNLDQIIKGSIICCMPKYQIDPDNKLYNMKLDMIYNYHKSRTGIVYSKLINYKSEEGNIMEIIKMKEIFMELKLPFMKEGEPYELFLDLLTNNYNKNNKNNSNIIYNELDKYYLSSNLHEDEAYRVEYDIVLIEDPLLEQNNCGSLSKTIYKDFIFKLTLPNFYQANKNSILLGQFQALHNNNRQLLTNQFVNSNFNFMSSEIKYKDISNLKIDFFKNDECHIKTFIEILNNKYPIPKNKKMVNQEKNFIDILFSYNVGLNSSNGFLTREYTLHPQTEAKAEAWSNKMYYIIALNHSMSITCSKKSIWQFSGDKRDIVSIKSNIDNVRKENLIVKLFNIITNKIINIGFINRCRFELDIINRDKNSISINKKSISKIKKIQEDIIDNMIKYNPDIIILANENISKEDVSQRSRIQFRRGLNKIIPDDILENIKNLWNTTAQKKLLDNNYKKIKGSDILKNNDCNCYINNRLSEINYTNSSAIITINNDNVFNLNCNINPNTNLNYLESNIEKKELLINTISKHIILSINKKKEISTFENLSTLKKDIHEQFKNKDIDSLKELLYEYNGLYK